MTPEEYADMHPEHAEIEREHDCNKCGNYKRDFNNGLCYCDCEGDCDYELRTPTLAEALDIFCETQTDYGDMTEEEIEEADKAIDVICAFVKKYVKDNTGEWKDYIDGSTGVLTTKGICSRCNSVCSWRSPFCPVCGRMMTDPRKKVTTDVK